MVTIFLDTETQGLDATKFIVGALKVEGKKSELFRSPQEMWERILELGSKEKKRGHKLFVYAHNHQYDFCGYADRYDKRIRYISYSPFIVQLDNIMFLDSYALFRCPLSKLSEFIGLQKQDTPDFLKDGTFTKEDFKTDFLKASMVVQYLNKDLEVLEQAVTHLKTLLRKQGVNPRVFYSAGQLSLSILLKFIRKTPELQQWLDDVYITPESKKTLYKRHGLKPLNNPSFIRLAYRGGRVEANRLGVFSNTTHIDINSLYPYALTQIPLPDLTKPLSTLTNKDFSSAVGSASVLIRKPANMVVPVRLKDSVGYPRHACFIYGVYTLLELDYFQKLGCEILHMDEFSAYRSLQTPNPFTQLVNDMYLQRKASKDEGFFWKLIMNNMTAKLAQSRNNFLRRVDSVLKEDEMNSKGFELRDFYDELGVYIKDMGTFVPRYYFPIIPAYVNAFGRIYLDQFIRRIPEDDFLYCDTDSILFRGPHKSKFPLSDRIGDFKIVTQEVPSRIYGRKCYSVDETIHVSGVSKIFLDKESFDKGTLTYKRMKGLPQDFAQAGVFDTYTIHFNDLTQRSIEEKELIRSQKLFVDKYSNPDIDTLINRTKCVDIDTDLCQE